MGLKGRGSRRAQLNPTREKGCGGRGGERGVVRGWSAQCNVPVEGGRLSCNGGYKPPSVLTRLEER